jgi:hypothetical protein
MKMTKLYSRFITFVLLLLFGIALGAKSAGVETSQVATYIAVLCAVTLLHFRMMRKRLAR